jgi:stage V sporulation protein R
MKDTTYDRLIANLKLLDPRITKAGLRLGLDPYTTDYYLVTDSQMAQNLVYVAMPVHYSHWRYGKQAQQTRPGHVFEVVINSDPSFCYLGTTNDLRMQALVIAHAKWGHVDFFKNNFLYKTTGAKDCVQRFRASADFVEGLYEHPDWRREGVELYLDAAHAIEHHVGWLPVLPGEENRDENALRDELMTELRSLKSRYELENIESDKEELGRQVQALENRLKCHPLTPTTNLLGFLADPANTQHLPKEARQLLKIVEEQGRYFQPQGRTKFMNEGWATYFEREVLIQPEVSMPFGMHFDLAKDWAMFDRSPSNWWLDPYGLGEQVWRWIDHKYCFDDGEETIKYKDLIWDEDNQILSEGKKLRTKTIAKRNRDKMFEVRRNYDDNRFLEEFMSKEFMEHLNFQGLQWMRGNENRVGLMEVINQTLKKNGWGAHAVERMPDTIEGLMELVEKWMNAAQNSEQWQAQIGTPAFPVMPQTLQEMAQVLQLVEAFDEDWHSLRQMLVRRTGYNSVPLIELVDTGRHTDGVWTLRHVFDEKFGPLLQSECRETIRYFRLLCGGPARLITKEQREDAFGRPMGDPAPYVYFTEDGDTVKEGFE